MVLKIYTDGACSYNPGPGGWGAIICFPDFNKKINGFERNTTNNRMELMAVIKSIETILNMVFQEKIKIEKLEIISDSAYVVNAINKKWLNKWHKNNFKTSDGGDVKNSDLWKQMYEFLESIDFIGMNIELIKIKGHAGEYFNEMVDKLAKQAITDNLRR